MSWLETKASHRCNENYFGVSLEEKTTQQYKNARDPKDTK